MSSTYMSDYTNTPTTIPGKPRAGTGGGNGVPEPRDFQDTGEIINAVMAAAPEGLMEAFVSKAAEHFGAQAGSGDSGGSAHAKAAKKQNSIIILLMILVGPGGAVGAHYALKGQAASNTHAVKSLDKSIHGTDKKPGLSDRVEQTEDNIRLIQVRVGTIDESVKSINASQTAIAGGIEELKTENVNRLKDELVKAERENRRLERLNRDR